MKTTNMQVSFDADKLNALRFYVTRKEMNVEDELQAHLDRLYEKMVPVQVREYIESQSGSEVTKQGVKLEDNTVRHEVDVDENTSRQELKSGEGREEKSTEKQPRQSKRQREKEQAAAEQAESQSEKISGQEEVEEENQGMSLGM